MHTTQLKPAANPAGRTTISSHTRSLLSRALVLIFFTLASISVSADEYVFMYNGYFVGNGSTPTTSFVPNASIYSGTSGTKTIQNANGYYIAYSSGSSTTQGDYNITINTNGYVYLTDYTNYYLNMSNPNSNNRAWRISNTTNYRATAYTVTTTQIPLGLSNIEINGNSGINTPGTFNYTHSNSLYSNTAFTQYEFSTLTYYSTNPANTASTTRPGTQTEVTTGYTWSLSANANGYATVNASTGAITVSAIPNQRTTITLTCTLTYSGQTVSVDMPISLSMTGVSGGTVTLDDREDHSWNYYSDTSLPQQLRSLNPADVKITYFGNGTGTISTTNGATPASSSWTQNASTVKVGPSDAADTFVYYKTLEREDGSTSDNPTGLCAYTTIPNPFSVRPTYQYTSGDLNKYCGFYMWRIKGIKNGKIYDAATNGSQKTQWTSGNVTTANTLYADHTYYFQPDDEYGMEVELEALWARAYVSTSGAGSYNIGVERNFYIITSSSSNSDITAGSYPCTYTSIYPNGTTNGTTAATSVSVYRRGGFTAKADSKIEYIMLYNNSSTITAAGYNLTIGRGVTAYNGTYCATTVKGMDGGSSSALDYTIRMESGIFQNFYMVSSARQTYSNKVSARAVLGCDYDRASNTNSLLKVASNGSGDIYGGTQMICSSASNKDNLTFDWLIKSGTFHEGQLGAASGGDESIYLGSSQSGSYNLQYVGKRRIIVEGGDLAGIAGGMNSSTSNGGSDYNNTTHVTQSTDDYVVIRIKGGNIRSSVYGAAAFAGASGGRKFIFTGGTIAGWVAGGANGTQTDGGTMYGPVNLYVGGNTQVNSNGSTSVINRAVGGNVFGAGCGYGASSNSGQILNYGTTVVVADDAYVERGVYGGGSYGYTTNTANLYILGGTVDGKSGGVNGTSYQASITGGVFGGACQNQGGTVNITMKDGHVNGGIYGGSNATGTVTGPVTIHVDGGQVGTTSSSANIHGGGYGSETVVTGNVDITLGTQNQNTPGVTVYGDVYGGSALGKVNGTSTSNSKHTNVTLNKGTINGSLYGGALGDNATAANVYAPVTVTVNGGKADNVYGCNNVNGKPQNTVSVTINGTDAVESGNAIGRVFGGGNQAAYSGTPDVNMVGGIVGTIYGGGNEAGVSGGDVAMTGGTVREGIYGGCNTSGEVGGNITVSITGGTIGVDANNKANVHGGGYGSATSSTGNVTVTIDNTNSRPTIWGDVYGGSGFGDVNDASADLTKVWLKNGTVHGDIYGGGLGDANNPAAVNGKVEVVVDGGTVTGRIFGCNNAAGAPQSTVKVDINGTDTPESGYALAAVYGGGNEAAYGGTPVVKIHNCDNSIEYVYGGGNAASVAATDVTIYGGNTIGTVFGGGNGQVRAANVTGNTNVKIYGGTIGKVFGGSNSQGTIGGQINVNIDKQTEADHSSCAMKIGEVYGGGNLAASSAGSVTIGCTGDDPANEGIDDVYGGANQADISGAITLNISGGIIKRVFGGNNTSGNITGKITVNVDWSGGCTNSLDYVYGGGNQAFYEPTTAGAYPEVNIIRATVNHDVFGGGLGATAKVYSNPKVTIGDVTSGHESYEAIVLGNVYGGGSAAMVGDTDQATASTNNTTVTIQNSNSSVGQVFGGGKAAGVTGTSTITLTAGSVSAGVYGGCDSVGTVSGDISVYLNGGTVGATNSRADVFGGGLGSATATGGHIGVTLGSATVYGDIYGGSALGQVNGSTSHTTNLSINGTSLNGTVYGGGKGQVQGDSIKAISNGNIIVNYNGVNAGLIGGIYGGANVNGNVKGKIQVNILANVGATSNNNSRNIFGGGYGDATTTEGNIEVNIGTLDGNKTPVIYGDIYGGSALGNVNKDASNTTTVNFRNGTLHGNLYGGGLGQKTPTPIAAKVNGKVYVNIGASNQSNCAINLTGVSIYGCNNTNGSPQDDVEVNIYNTAHNTTNAASYTENDGTNGAPTYAIYQVFGGGNEADYSPAAGKKTTVNILGCNNTIQRVFGGGNAAAALGVVTTIDGGRFDYVFGGGNGESQPANIGTGGTNLTVHGGKINYLFGGSNTSGTISGSMGISVDATGSCASDMYIAEFFCGNNLANIGTAENPVNINATIGCDTKFGDVYGGCNLADIVGNVTLTVVGGEMNRVFGGSKGRSATSDPSNSTPKAANINGDVTLNITGGKIGSAFGGSNINGNITGSIEVNVEKAANPCVWQIGDVFGASNDAAYTPSKEGNTLKVNIKNGTIGGSVFGGGKGPTATATSNPQVTIGDATEGYTAVITGDVYGGGDAAAVDGVPVVRVINKCNTSIGNVYGGGNAADVSATSVTIDGGTITGDVYGGGHGDKAILNVGNETGHSDKVANVNGNVSVTVTGGTIHRVFGGSNTNGNITGTVAVNVNKGANSCDLNIDELYGGGNMAAGNAGSITIGCTGGANEGIGDVYGGANQADIGSSSQASNISLSITGGKIGRVFGGNNTSGTIYGTIQVNIDWATGNDACGVNSLGSVFGGGNQASYSAPTGSTNYPVVNIKNGTITNNVFGGGLGATAVVKGNPQVTIGDATRLNNDAIVAVVSGDVYGGGDAAAVDGVPVVRVINKCNTSIGNVYGGGNAADVSATSVTIDGGTITGDVYGGGHGDKAILNVGNETGHSDKVANVNGNVSVTVTGGTIHRVFGGSNTNGNITGTVAVNVNKGANSCDLNITELYGGGNMAAGNAGSITIGCTGGANEGIGDVYGGANQADIGSLSQASNIALSITGGKIGRVFGGNNTSGTIYGTIQVDVEWATGNDACGVNSLGSVFGGGNQASYSAPTGSTNYPVVNIKNGTITNNVFGGGLGATAVVKGNPQVTIGDATEGYAAVITGDVYGGGDAASVSGTPMVRVINKSNTSIGNVYGGGNAADVSATSVTIDGGTITGDVFGGGHGDKLSLATQEDPDHSDKEANVGGDVTVLITGGTINRVFGGSNANGNIGGEVNVTVRKETTSCDMHIAELYGGGNMANGNAGTITIVRTGGDTEGIGDVYGGANKADIGTSENHSDIELTITGGSIDNVFGGNNNSGTIYGNIQVNVNISNNVGTNYIGNVYGGGNVAPYSNSGSYPEVNIINGTVSGNVFGGGLGANARVTANPKVVLTGGTISGKVFGGGEAAPVYGNPTVIANNATASRLYGGGLGTTATVIGFTTVTVNGGTYGYVFGGGEEAGLSRSATVNIAGGTITYDVYGGGALAHTNTSNYNTSSGAISINTDTTKVNLTGGTVHNVYGGGLGDLAEEGVGHQDVAAIVYGNVLVNLNKGVASGSKGSIVTGNIFGCNNINGTPKGSVTVHVYGTQNSHVSTIGDKSYTPFEFDVPAVYGGGNMAAYIPASNIPTHVIIEGCGLTSIGYVYGGGNAAPVPATNVLIMGSDTIYSVFGGGNGKDKITVGNQQKDNPGADVGIRQVSIDEYSLATNYQYNDPKYTTDKYYIMYGDTVGTSIIGTTTVTILGGTVEQLFGGSNTKGDIIKEAKVLLGDEDLKTCEFNVGGVYGGSNEAYMSGSADIEMRCMDGMAQIYGGSRMADVSQDIVLTITGGHYDKVFGGNNLSGRIYGSITINIEQTGCLPIKIGELYGGGNQAPYSIYGYKSTSRNVTINNETVTHYDLNETAVAGTKPYSDPVINIVSCDSIGKVFGGGLMAEMVGSPHIYVDMVRGWTDGSYTGQKPGVKDPNKDYANTKYKYEEIGTIDTIFGGGNMADVIGDSYIFIGTRDSITIHDVKKGVYDVISVGRTDIKDPAFANNADSTATKDLRIQVEGAKITGNIYGGGNMANITGQTYINVGPEEQRAQPANNQQPAPARPAPIRTNQAQSATPQTNAATQSDQTRNATLIRQ